MLQHWQSQYDPTLGQVYYTNPEDGSISFDTPCEVQNTSSGFLGKISKLFASRDCRFKKQRKLRSLSSRSSSSTLDSHNEPAEKAESARPAKQLPVESYSSVLDMPFDLLEDTGSISSEESIQSYREAFPSHEIYYDYDERVFVDSKAIELWGAEREREIEELRIQFLKELF